MRRSELAVRGYSVDAMRVLAKKTLPRFVFDFADGGAEDEWTLRRNERAFDDFMLVPRPLEGAGERDLSLRVFGSRISMPVMIGPTGLAGLFWPRGEECIARAAQSAGTAFCLSHGSVCTLEEVAKVGSSPRWMQVFIYKDRGFTRELAERAQHAGYDALVLTVDNQALGKRERDIRNGFSIPPRFGPAEIAEMMLKVGWLWRMRSELNRITLGNYVRPDQSSDIKALAGKMPGMLDQAMSWKDVDALRRHWKGPLVLKGVLHPDEAREAIQHGVRRGHRLEPWRPATRRCAGLARCVAGGCARRGRKDSAIPRRRGASRHQCGKGVGPGRDRVLRRAAAALGALGSRCRRGRAHA